MLLKSLKLHNIRSYENQEISFPLGSVLLAGDIGSGKSTVLLAIEFAIFGAKKGELPAYTLLRHGKKEGNVELRMQIDGKDVIIKRALKRNNDDIRQDSGYVIVNGLKKDGTAEELRAWILDLLGYPKDLIKKGKDLIYRYTVYTPQEQMKQILYEDKETRLETLRKVFNIDKYKRIRDNCRIVVSSMKEKKKHLEGFTQDLEYKKKDLQERKSEILQIEISLSGIMPKIFDLKSIINQKKNSIDAIENDVKELNNLRKELSLAESGINYKIEFYGRLNDEIKKLEKLIDELKKEVEDKNFDEITAIQKKIDEKEKEMAKSDAEHRTKLRLAGELEVKMQHCNDAIKKIQSLQICPFCEQQVDEKHKQEISSREHEKHELLIWQANNCKKDESYLEKFKFELRKELNFLVKEQNYLNVLKIKSESMNEKSTSREEKISLKEKTKKEIGVLNAKKADLISKIQNYSQTEEKYKAARKEIDDLLPQERFLELEKRKYETQKDSIARFVLNLEDEINKKQKAKEKLAEISQLISWAEEFFPLLMSTMERHVMLNIHMQFNELFRNWFDIIMEDKTINIRVDEEFTPVIEQDGYETYIDNLSGGEKTSVALSYRLALNKVINDIVSTIKTKDIIILDEPTDGFSTEQLDKLRDILNQLNMKQVIIVSHESKIESLAENIIRLEKQDNVSSVV